MGCGSSTASTGAGNDEPRTLVQEQSSEPPQETAVAAAAPLAVREPEPTAADCVPEADAEVADAAEQPPAPAPEPEPEPQTVELSIELAFDAVKDLWFSAAELGRGRALVALQDTVTAHQATLAQLFAKFTSASEPMTKAQWAECASAMTIDLDEDVLGNHYDEVIGYPDEDDEDAETGPASLGQFASMLCRVANDLTLQSNGMADGPDLAGQLMEFLREHAPRLGVAVAPEAEVALAHGDDFFRPPAGWGQGKPVRRFMDLAIAGGSSGGEAAGGRVTFELNTDVTPITAYNFYALCTGERGLGVVDRKPLTFRGSVFHRIIADM